MPEQKYTGEDLLIGVSEQAQEALAEDPELASAVKDMMAKFRQAQQAFHEGRYSSFEEALAALGVRATKIRDEDVAP